MLHFTFLFPLFSKISITCSFAEKTYKLLLVYGKELEISKSGVGAPPVSTSSVLCQLPHQMLGP